MQLPLILAAISRIMKLGRKSQHHRSWLIPKCIVNSFVRVFVAVANLPNRSQKRAFLKHTPWEAKILPLEFIADHFDLYHRYQLSRHANQIDGNSVENTEDEEDQYRQFLVQSHIDSYMVEFRENGILRMVSVIDIVSDGLSSVYTFFDTSQEKASYGTYGILWQIEILLFHRSNQYIIHNSVYGQLSGWSEWLG